MQFDSWQAFLAMEGHGLYVWLAYAATVLVLAGSYLVVRIAAFRQQRNLAWMVQAGQQTCSDGQPLNISEANISEVNTNEPQA